MIAGALLPVAEAIDPALVREVACLAIALRPSRPWLEPPDGADGLALSDARLALLLARYDRGLARELLEPVVEHLRGNPVAPQRAYVWRPAFAALALTDPSWALEVAESLALDEARLVVAAVLARPPEQRWDFVQDGYLSLWVVGKEDP